MLSNSRSHRRVQPNPSTNSQGKPLQPALRIAFAGFGFACLRASGRAASSGRSAIRAQGWRLLRRAAGAEPTGGVDPRLARAEHVHLRAFAAGGIVAHLWSRPARLIQPRCSSRTLRRCSPAVVAPSLVECPGAADHLPVDTDAARTRRLSDVETALTGLIGLAGEPVAPGARINGPRDGPHARTTRGEAGEPRQVAATCGRASTRAGAGAGCSSWTQVQATAPTG